MSSTDPASGASGNGHDGATRYDEEKQGAEDGQKKRRAEDGSVERGTTVRRRTRVSKFEPSKRDSHKGFEVNGDPGSPKHESSDASVLVKDAVVGQEIISSYVKVAPIPPRGQRFPPLTPVEIQELEKVLEFEATKDSWRDDWAGNLAFVDKEIRNPRERGRDKQPFRQTLLDWCLKAPENIKYVWNIIRYVLKHAPEPATRILSNVDPTALISLEQAIRLTSYHPEVLAIDGWSIVKAAESQPPIGGPHLIGDRIRWEQSDAVVIAYVHDPDIGDLWKALSVDRGDPQTFDLEAEELLDSKQKYERRQQRNQSRRSSRFAASSDFRVDGIESGIVLAGSYSKGSRPGVFWPARLMHASEAHVTTGKRSSSKQKVDVVFLAPYWNTDEASRGHRVESLSASDTSAFSSGPLLQIESIEATEDMIRPYHYDGDDVIDLDVLRTSFRFTGLPRAVFGRYVDSHRLALALRKYARECLDCGATATERATAGLFERHPMTVQAPIFPRIILELPLAFIVSQLPRLLDDSTAKSANCDDEQSNDEPVINLSTIVSSMKPPACFGLSEYVSSGTPKKSARFDSVQTTPSSWMARMRKGGEKVEDISAEDIFQDLTHLNGFLQMNVALPSMNSVLQGVLELIELARRSGDEKPSDVSCGGTVPDASPSFYIPWSILKSNGEQVISSVPSESKIAVVSEWRRALERLYMYLVSVQGRQGKSVILTDLRCNGHRTDLGCFERTVRLPAAVKAARLAGATSDGPVKLMVGIPDFFIKFAEEHILPKAHTTSYVKKIQGRCDSAKSEEQSIMLTDDSDGKGGHDTMGSKGTWSAAVCSVAAALKATEMVVHGRYINGFCATRPPGHHAGRSLHPMKAISNGFCVLNAAACAAIYATTPVSENGLGLSRVCVIDFDVHHGNGTQDILCSTYDPRFLYVSMHAGGAQVNGSLHDEQDDPNHELHDLASNPKSGGIYPGRCGDTSPHKGVLNIPLGSRVTPHEVGNALIQYVTPAVDRFAPDLIILSAGFDAHKNDPMSLGTLSAKDFGHITEVACTLASKSCSGRVVSVLEGGYGVPCCRPQRDDPTSLCLPVGLMPVSSAPSAEQPADHVLSLNGSKDRPQPASLLSLGEDLPDFMDDQVPYALQRRLDKCHAEGFVECVKEHVAALAMCSD